MTVCNLCDLELGLPGVSSAMGTALTEAGIFCLESQNHKSNTDLILDGNYGNKKICLVWDKEVTNQIKKNMGGYARSDGIRSLRNSNNVSSSCN